MKTIWPQETSDPFGVYSDFNWHEIGAIFRVIGEHKVKFVVETGAGRGDLAAWMISKTRFDSDFQYLGITNDPNSMDTKVKAVLESNQAGLSFVAVGAPCSDFVSHRVAKMIRNSECAMVLCDGTNIDHEVSHYIDFLRPGDIIMAHRFLEEYSGRSLFQMIQSGKIDRIVGSWLSHTRIIVGKVA